MQNNKKTKKLAQLISLYYLCSLKRKRPMKRIAEILSRFLRAANAS